MINKIKAIIVIASLFVVGMAQADQVSGHVSLSNNYMTRGVSMTNNNSAVQGGFDYTHGTGIYGGIKATNVYSISETNIETIGTVGFKNKLSNGVGYNVGGSKYYYNNVSGTGSQPSEFFGNVTYDHLIAGYAYSPNWYSNKSAQYVHVGYRHPVPYDLVATAKLGYSFGDAFNNNEYTNYSLGLSTTAVGLNLAVEYVGNDINNRASNEHNRFVFSAGKRF